MYDIIENMVYLPPGWPRDVRPPGATEWEVTATEFLLDCCPPDFRAYGVLRRHPIVLARFAAEFVAGQSEAARTGLAGVRTSLKGIVSQQVIESAAEAWLEEEARLARTRRAVTLIEQALRGSVFVAKL